MFVPTYQAIHSHDQEEQNLKFQYRENLIFRVMKIRISYKSFVRVGRKYVSGRKRQKVCIKINVKEIKEWIPKCNSL